MMEVEYSVVHRARREWICSRCHKKIAIGKVYARTEEELLCSNEFNIKKVDEK